MKCIRCGKIVSDDTKVCPNCAYDFKEITKRKTVIVEVDEETDKAGKVMRIDNPILTFIFGILSLLFGLTLLANRLPIPLIVVLLFFASFMASFYFSTKPCKVSMKPVRNMGIVLAFIGFALSAYSLIYALLTFSGIL